MNEPVRHPRWRIKRRKEPASQIVRHLKQLFITSDLIGAQQAAKLPNGDLKYLYRDILVEREVLLDEIAGLIRFFFEAEQIQRVKRVDRCHVDRRPIPVAARLAQRL